jgi:glycosyltransferase involved in cell wall biosynthesis
MTKGISIIICCYNSARRIEQTLIHVGALQLPPLTPCEVLLINNNSTDNTVSVAENVFNKINNESIPLIIINEPNPGLTSARARGIIESKYDTILFCDDDNHLDSSYLVQSMRILDRDPSIGLLGCWSKPKLPFYPGRWIEDFYGALAIGKQGESDGFVRWIFGAGMVLRKKVLDDLNRYGIRLQLTDRVGMKQTSGGDTEICLMAIAVGYQIYYSSSLVLEHCISSSRLSRWSFIKSSSENFFPVAYLYLLDMVVSGSSKSSSALFAKLFFSRIYKIFHFIPRCIFGKHQFYSFVSVLGNILFTGWMLANFSIFRKTLSSIKSNLVGHGKLQ